MTPDEANRKFQEAWDRRYGGIGKIALSVEVKKVLADALTVEFDAGGRAAERNWREACDAITARDLL